MHHCAIEYGGHEGHAGHEGQRGASLNEAGCKDRQAYSPENIRQNGICCLGPNFRKNTIDQGRSAGGNGRTNFKATRDVCCELYQDQNGGVDAIRTIGCTFSNK